MPVKGIVAVQLCKHRVIDIHPECTFYRIGVSLVASVVI